MATQSSYQGGDVLDQMAAAKNYNAFLKREVLRHAADATWAVDFGAGIGTIAKLVREAGLEVTCIEPDIKQLSGLRSDGFTSYPDLNKLQAGSVPYLYTLNVLEHIEDDQKALRAIFDVLCPDGRCFLYVPAFPVLYSSFDRKVGHFRRYRRDQLASLFQAQGFIVEQARYVDSVGFLVALVFRLVESKDGAVDERAISIYDRLLFPLSLVLDHVMGRILGKNVMIVARKPAA